MLGSRIEATKEVVRIIQVLNQKPKVLINGSAIGIYGTSLDKTFTEETEETGNDFLADVVKKWEETALTIKDEVRIVFARFGMVLHKDEGALNKMLLPFKLFVGGKLGSGKQWMSWVHIDDVCDAILYSIKTEAIEGAINITAPTPVKMQQFCKVLGEAMKRPCWAPVPSFILKIVLGEMSILVLEGQRVLPNKLEKSGYSFQYKDLKEALQSLLS